MRGYLIAAIFAAFILGSGAGYWKGSVDGDTQCAATINTLQKAAQDKKDEGQNKADQTGEELEKGNGDAQIHYQTITRYVDRIIDRPVYRDLCFDVDGLRAANIALVGPAAPSRERDGALPRPDAP